MTITWQIAKQPPRVHFALVGEWLLVIRPYTTNRFGAWAQRIGWERGDEQVFRSVQDAKRWLGEAIAKESAT